MPRARADALVAAGKLELFQSRMNEAGWEQQSRSDTVYANTAVVLGPKGVEKVHRKTLRWPNEVMLGAAVGTEGTLLETPYGRFGVQICLGAFNKDVTESYREAKVDAVLFPGDWAEEGYNGFVGLSATSLDFIAKAHELPIFGADDGTSSRTGIHYYDETLIEANQVNKYGQIERKTGDLVMLGAVHF